MAEGKFYWDKDELLPGTGFKLGPVTGRMLADLAMKVTERQEEEALSMRRFRGRTSWDPQFRYSWEMAAKYRQPQQQQGSWCTVLQSWEPWTRQGKLVIFWQWRGAQFSVWQVE